MDTIILQILKNYGIAGALMLSPLVAIYFVWKDSQNTKKELSAALEKVNDTHMKRVEDAKQVSTKLMEMVAEHAELTKETNIALDRVGDALTIIHSRGLPIRNNKRASRDEGEEDAP